MMLRSVRTAFALMSFVAVFFSGVNSAQTVRAQDTAGNPSAVVTHPVFVQQQRVLPGFWAGEVTGYTDSSDLFLYMASTEMDALTGAFILQVGGTDVVDVTAQNHTVLETGLRISFKAPAGALYDDKADLLLRFTYSDGSDALYDTQGLTVSLDTGGSDGAASLSIPLALVFAFIGGLVLNLMPCVFPILSLKALALAGSQGMAEKERRAEGNYYTIGVLISFAVIAGLLLILRAGGEVIGWGFQLQNPIFVGFLAIIMTLVGLSLIGLFDIRLGAEDAGQGLAGSGGRRGAFFTGVLATLVATPCTAPLMAPALGFAIAQPPAISMLVFLTLGLGMASPFLLIAWVPASGKLLPRPGPWMNTLKQGLAFPMFLTVAWLIFVYMQQIGAAGGFLILIVLISLTFGVWLWSQSKGMIARGLSVLIMAGSMLAVAFTPLAAPSNGSVNVSSGNLKSEPWSQEKLREVQSTGAPIFVYFTADWCITCKFNERTSIYREATVSYFAEKGIQVLRGDWTNQNQEIAEELFRWGRAGVPMYLYYPAGGGEAVILPELMTQDSLINAIKAAE